MTECSAESDFNGEYMTARIISVFVLLVLLAAGSFFPLLAQRYKSLHIPPIVLFLTRYFGTGVILATAFIHLLGESQTSFSHPCVGEFLSEDYAWASALSLMGTVTMFTIEIFTHRAIEQKRARAQALESTAHGLPADSLSKKEDDILVHEHAELDESALDAKIARDAVIKALVNIYLLEFGIVFHSVFVGLSLAIAGEQFITLFVAISFHQFFEGMGLGARFAVAEWPPHLKRMPWYLSGIYSLTTPVGIAAGLGVRHLYSANSRESLIVVGVFDGFCSGLLIYSSLVELMARDFMYDTRLTSSSNRRYVLAYFMFICGTVMMAVVGKWA